MRLRSTSIFLVFALIASIFAVVVNANVSAEESNNTEQSTYPSGLVSYWKFDEGSGTSTMDSVGNNNGTINGATWTAGKLNNSLSFNGNNNYVVIPSSENLNITYQVTLEAWVKRTTEGTSWEMIINKDPANLPDDNWFLGIYQNTARFRVNTASKKDLDSNIKIVAGFWYHIVGTYDRYYLRIYVNGVEANKMAETNKINAVERAVHIGTASGGTSYPFDGLIDEVAIYNRSLNSDEIRQHYNNGIFGKGYFEPEVKPILTPLNNMISYWKLDENNGTVAIDNVNYNHGMIHGGKWSTGIVNYSFELDGIDDYISIPNNSSLEPDAITVETWVNVKSFSSKKMGGNSYGQYIIFKQNSRTSNFEGFKISMAENTKKFGAMVTSSSGAQIGVGMQDTVKLGQWYHLVLVANSVELKFYINGLLQGSKSTGFNLDYGSRPVYIGRSGEPVWDGYFNGCIDEVVIFNKTLSDRDIFLHYYKSRFGEGYCDEEVFPPLSVWVDDDYDNTTHGWGMTHFNKIQEAINIVNYNGTVYINLGIYEENLKISKSLKLLSKNRDSTFINGSGNNDVINIISDNVTISGFNIINSGNSNWDAGIELESVQNCCISNNILIDNKLILSHSTYNLIEDNYLNGSSCPCIKSGIDLLYSNNNRVINNVVTEWSGSGVFVDHSFDNLIIDNIIEKNDQGGSDDSGIGIDYSENTTISRNKISGNGFSGIRSLYSNKNLITNNKIYDHLYGMYWRSWDYGNIIYLNEFKGNNKNVAGTSGLRFWNSTQNITYFFVNSTFTNYLGNYWDDYILKYPHAESYGNVWNIPYLIEGMGGEEDYYPLKEPMELEAVSIYRSNPNFGPNITTVTATIYGYGFHENVSVMLRKDDIETIEGENIQLIDKYELKTRFNLSDCSLGLWDIVVILPSGFEIILEDGFNIINFLSSIFPTHGLNLSTRSRVNIYGYGFSEGMEIKLTRDNENEIPGIETVVLNENQATTRFNLYNNTLGLWNLSVKLPTGYQSLLSDAFEIMGSNMTGYLYSEIVIKSGEVQYYDVVIPETENLFVTLRKKTQWDAHTRSWDGSLKLFLEHVEIAGTSGPKDYILHVVDPTPGIYRIEVTSYHAGEGILEVGTSLPELPLGEWIVETIYWGWGSVWYQVEVPPDQDTLYFESEGIGRFSKFQISYEEYSSSNKWVSLASGDDRRIYLEIPNPIPGTYIVQYTDSQIINDWRQDQTRDVLINADTTSSIKPPPDYIPRISHISPVTGGNVGTVTIEIIGVWLDENASVKLTRAGYEDIMASDVTGSPDGSTLIAAFNLVEKDPGEWKLVVTNPNGQSVTGPESFMIEEGGESKIWAELIGCEQIRVGRQARYILRYGNSGNIDTKDVCIHINTSNLKLIKVEREDKIVLIDSIINTEFSEPALITLPKLRSGEIRELKVTVYTDTPGTFVLAWIVSDIAFDFIGDVLWNTYKHMWEPVGNEQTLKEAFWICFKKGWQDTIEEWKGGEAALWSAVNNIGGRLLKDSVLGPFMIPYKAAKFFTKWAEMTLEGGYLYLYGKESKDVLRDLNTVYTLDPEEKYGPTGYDFPETPINESKHFVSADQNFYYLVEFWNKENATAPATDVYVYDQLDSNFNWGSFQFEEVGFLNWSIDFEPTKYFNIYVDTRPEMNLIVNIEGIFNPESGNITLAYKSLDPETLEMPDDPLAGFLPPITDLGYEIGWFTFSVNPNPGLPSGAEIKNQVWINFDGIGPYLPAPKEGPFVNTIDADPSEVTDLNFVPDRLNTKNDPQEITFTLNLSDGYSGIGLSGSYLRIRSPSGETTRVSSGSSWNLTSGDLLDGVYEALMEFPQNSELGIWHIDTLYIEDNVGNGITYNEQDLIGLGFNTEFEIIENQPPVANPGSPYTSSEGSPIIFDASASYDPDGDELRFRWDFDNDGIWDTSYSIDPTASYTWNDDYIGEVAIEVFDGEETDSTSVVVTVINVPPIAYIDRVVQPFYLFILPYDELEFHGSFSDPGTLDTHTIIWDFGDGATAIGTLSPTRAYSEPGIYTVTLTVTDDDGGEGTASVEIIVKSQEEAIEVIKDNIENMALLEGIENSLMSKLDNAIKSLGNGQDNAAMNQLEAFINELEAQRGKKLKVEEADALIAAAQWIIDNLSNNGA